MINDMQETDNKMLMQIADCTSVPRTIMTYLMEIEIISMMNDVHLIPINGVNEIQIFYKTNTRMHRKNMHMDSHDYKSIQIHGGLI